MVKKWDEGLDELKRGMKSFWKLLTAYCDSHRTESQASGGNVHFVGRLKYDRTWNRGNIRN